MTARRASLIRYLSALCVMVGVINASQHDAGFAVAAIMVLAFVVPLLEAYA